eukprot:1182729-Pyramimonas_sp.AAC.1
MSGRNRNPRNIDVDIRQLREKITSMGLSKHSKLQALDDFQSTWVKVLKVLSGTLVVILFALLLSSE